jgi:hypothetical protein
MLAAIQSNKDIAELIKRRRRQQDRLDAIALCRQQPAGHHQPVADQHAYIDAGSPNGTTPLMMAREIHWRSRGPAVGQRADDAPEEPAGLTVNCNLQRPANARTLSER